jgi:hypothetical protein
LSLERLRYEYTELSENWKVIDSKAQRTAAFAAAFLVALLAIVRDLPPGPNLLLFKALASALGVALVFAMAFAFQAIRIQQTFMPTGGRAAWDKVAIAANDSLARWAWERQRRELLALYVADWLEVNDYLDRLNGRKADRVTLAQDSLAWAAGIAFLILMARIWFSR